VEHRRRPPARLNDHRIMLKRFTQLHGRDALLADSTASPPTCWWRLSAQCPRHCSLPVACTCRRWFLAERRGNASTSRQQHHSPENHDCLLHHRGIGSNRPYENVRKSPVMTSIGRSCGANAIASAHSPSLALQHHLLFIKPAEPQEVETCPVDDGFSCAGISVYVCLRLLLPELRGLPISYPRC
jgi:hypothetical protein